ncbi:MAG: hypothetical protein K8U57_06485 [Planctomycetes bacterium]|nr:hypothetical protein [Planctomycetota bacterium]
MTDREPIAPADTPPQLDENAACRVLIHQSGGARTANVGGPTTHTNAHPESALRGDGPPMSLTLAPRPHVRAPATDEPPADPVRTWLARLSNAVAELSSFAPLSIGQLTDLTVAEADAVCRAAACPDLFVIHAPDHVVRERVIAAISQLSATRSGRCLVLSPNPAAADRITERLAKIGETGVVRALADDENPARPSPVVSKITSAAIGTARADRLKRDAATAVAEADARLTALEKLTELASKVAEFDAEIAELAVRRQVVESVVRAETDSPFATKLTALKASHEAFAASITTEIETLSLTRKEKETALVGVQQQLDEATAETAKKPSFFSRLIGKGKQGPDPADLAKQIQSLEAEIATIKVRSAEAQSKLTATATASAVEREQAILAEVASRQAEVDSHVASKTSERDRISTEAEVLGTTLGVVPLASELASTQYAATLALVRAKEHAVEVDRTAAEIARQFLARMPVVVGTPGSLHVDPVFDRDPANDGDALFSLLVLDQAEELGEQEFIQLAKLASRWVLIGDTAPADETKPHLNGSAPRHGPGRNGRPVEPPFTAKLAKLLDHEKWCVEGDRLVCRLLHASHEQRRGMTREPLLDRPEIELRFLLDSNGEPAVAEVAFPSAAGIGHAKSFLFHQLSESLLRPHGALTWDHSPNAITACWLDAERGTADSTWIDLEPGVREKVVGVGLTAFTAAVSFDVAAEWDAERAAAWLSERLRCESTGRFAVVPRTSRV